MWFKCQLIMYLKYYFLWSKLVFAFSKMYRPAQLYLSKNWKIECFHGEWTQLPIQFTIVLHSHLWNLLFFIRDKFLVIRCKILSDVIYCHLKWALPEKYEWSWHLELSPFNSADEIPLLRLHGSELTSDFVDKHGFDTPVLVEKKDGLGLSLPPSNFSIQDVEFYVGRFFFFWL